MKKSLKRRFIIGAMLSFLIVILLLLSSMVVMNYQNQEKRADAFLHALLDEDIQLMESPPPNWFGYQFTQESFPAGFYTITASTAGEILEIDQIGILRSKGDVEAVTAQIVREGRTSGKAGAYQYRAAYHGQEGTVRMVLLDRTNQILSLYNVLETGVLAGLGCLAMLFLVLQPIADHLANEWLRKTEKQKQFITNAGHELKTPVAIILSNTEALELIEGESKYSRNIHQQTRRLDQLIRQLLMVARLDEIRYRSETRVLDFSRLAEESCKAFAESMPLVCTVQKDCWLRGHDESLRQMMDVLLDNACRYRQGDQPVKLTVRQAGRMLEMDVENQVSALPSCEPEELFERFCRGDHPHSSSGCGVGLSAARTIVLLHRGSIRIRYPVPHTFCVSISMPLHRMKKPSR